jgi:hypothetical protein
MNKILSVLWILVGIYLIRIGILDYLQYSKSGVLWLVIIPEYLAITNIILGIFCIRLGKNLFQNDRKSIRLLILISLLIPSLTIGSIILDLIEFGDIVMWVFLISLYSLYILIALTFINLKKQSIIMTKKDIWDSFVKFKYYLLINCVVIVSLTLLLTILIPYKLFSHY